MSLTSGEKAGMLGAWLDKIGCSITWEYPNGAISQYQTGHSKAWKYFNTVLKKPSYVFGKYPNGQPIKGEDWTFKYSLSPSSWNQRRCEAEIAKNIKAFGYQKAYWTGTQCYRENHSSGYWINNKYPEYSMTVLGFDSDDVGDKVLSDIPTGIKVSTDSPQTQETEKSTNSITPNLTKTALLLGGGYLIYKTLK